MTHQDTLPVPPTLTVHETARVMKVTPATVYAWVRADEIPFLKFGGRIRIPTSKLADLLGITPGEIVDGLR